MQEIMVNDRITLTGYSERLCMKHSFYMSPKEKHHLESGITNTEGQSDVDQHA